MPKDLGFQPTPGFPDVFLKRLWDAWLSEDDNDFGLGTPAVPFFPVTFRGGM